MTNLKRLKCRLCGWSTKAEAKSEWGIVPDPDAMERMQEHWRQAHWDDLMIVEAKEENENPKYIGNGFDQAGNPW